MSQVTYFAYGSNMSLPRLQSRIPTAVKIGLGRLRQHKLIFHKVSQDGSSKCDIVPSETEIVLGVLFSLPIAELARLDEIEGCGNGYERQTVTVEDGRSRCIKAQTYKATQVRPSLAPYSWYKRHVLEGAKAAKLPKWYIAVIQQVKAVEDSDKLRETKEIAIYR